MFIDSLWWEGALVKPAGGRVGHSFPFRFQLNLSSFVSNRSSRHSCKPRRCLHSFPFSSTLSSFVPKPLRSSQLYALKMLTLVPFQLNLSSFFPKAAQVITAVYLEDASHTFGGSSSRPWLAGRTTCWLRFPTRTRPRHPARLGPVENAENIRQVALGGIQLKKRGLADVLKDALR